MLCSGEQPNLSLYGYSVGGYYYENDANNNSIAYNEVLCGNINGTYRQNAEAKHSVRPIITLTNPSKITNIKGTGTKEDPWILD